MEWSPLHNLKSLRRKQEQQQEKSPDAVKDDNDNPASLVAKEHFVFTDPEGQLYHFSVEGNAIKDGTKVPAEASLCKCFIMKFQLFIFKPQFSVAATITCISWKSDHIVRGDSDVRFSIFLRFLKIIYKYLMYFSGQSKHLGCTNQNLSKYHNQTRFC